MKEEVKNYINKAKKKESFTTDDFLDWLRNIYKLLDFIDDQDKYNTALAGICHIADINNKDLMVQSGLR